MNPENPRWKEITPFIHIKQNGAKQSRAISIQSSSPELFGDVKRIFVELDIKLKRIEFRLAQSTTQWLGDFKKILNSLNPSEAWCSEVTSIYVRLGLNCKRAQSNSEERWRALKSIQTSIIKGESYSNTPYEKNGICLTLFGTLTKHQESELEAQLRTCNLPDVSELDTEADGSISVGRVTFLLNCDSNLCNNWIQFYDNFRFETDKSGILREEWIAGKIQIRDILQNILEQWVAEKGQNATIGNLVDIVKPQYYTIATDLLQEEQDNSKTGMIQLDPEESSYHEPKYQPITSPGLISILRFGGKTDAGATFKIYPDYLFQMLNKVKDLPVVIISINGKKRTGKSFMFNNFIKYLKWDRDNDNWIDSEIEGEGSEFTEHMQTTSGIQVWSEPIRVKTNGREVAVIAVTGREFRQLKYAQMAEFSPVAKFKPLEVQKTLDDHKANAVRLAMNKIARDLMSLGIQREQETAKPVIVMNTKDLYENSIIFSFSALLSSIYIHNEQQDVPDLSYLVKPGSNDSDQIELQKLVLLLRDWESQAQYKWGYYDDATCPEGQVENLNKVLSSPLTSLSQEISVYAMPSPGDKLPDPPNHMSRSWDPNFRSHVISFVKQILSPSSLDKATKRISGVELSADTLKDFIAHWTDRIQEGLPLIDSKPTEIEHKLARDFDTKLKFGGFVKPSFLSNIKTYTSCLGYGAFGIVLKGIDESDTPSAIKFLFPDHYSDHEELRREYKVVQDLPQHENLVQIMGVEELTSVEIDKILKDLPYNKPSADLKAAFIERAIREETNPSVCIQMQFCGSNLESWLKEKHQQNELHVQIRQTRIVQGMINGLKFLHQHEIVHRDLKPENIVFSRGRYQLPVKIGDFGHSRLIHSEETQTGSLTSGGGEWSYTAPEVLSSGVYTHQSDLYSLGLIIRKITPFDEYRGIYPFDTFDEEKNIFEEVHPIMRGIKEIITGLTKRQTAERTKSLDEVNTETWEAALVDKLTRKGCKPLWDVITSHSENWNVKTSEELELCLDNAREGCTINLADGEYPGDRFVLWENGVKIVGNGTETVLRGVDPYHDKFLVIYGSDCTISDVVINIDHALSRTFVDPSGIVINGDRTTIKNVEINSSGVRIGLKISGSLNTIDHVIMNNSQRWGILVEENSNSNTISNITGLNIGGGIGVRGSNNALTDIKLEKKIRGIGGVGVWLSGSSNTISKLTSTGHFSTDGSLDNSWDLYIDSLNTTVKDSQCGSVIVWLEGKDVTLTNVDCGELIQIGERASHVRLVNCCGQKISNDSEQVTCTNCNFDEVIETLKSDPELDDGKMSPMKVQDGDALLKEVRHSVAGPEVEGVQSLTSLISEILSPTLIMELSKYTDVSASLLTNLKIRQIITPALISKIKKEDDPYTRADMLYEFLQKFAKNEHLAGLKEALKISGHAKALKILENAEKTFIAPDAGQDIKNSADAPGQGQQITQKSEIVNASKPALKSSANLKVFQNPPQLPPQPAENKRKKIMKPSEIGEALKNDVLILENLRRLHENFEVGVGDVQALRMYTMYTMDHTTAGDGISKIVTAWRGARYDELATGKHFLEILVNAGYKSAAETLRKEGLADDTLIKY